MKSTPPSPAAPATLRFLIFCQGSLDPDEGCAGAAEVTARIAELPDPVGWDVVENLALAQHRWSRGPYGVECPACVARRAGTDDESVSIEPDAAAGGRELAPGTGLVLVPGTCRRCGCTDARACEGGCGWADRDHTLCTRCA